jgi:hypothetical protein
MSIEVLMVNNQIVNDETEAVPIEYLRINVSFGVRGDSLIPADLTSQLGIQPSHAFAKGEEYASKAGTRKRPWGVWQLRSEASVSSSNIENHARFILEQLEPKRSIIMKYLESDEFYVDLRIWCEPEAGIASFGISSSILARLAAMCKEFNFSFIGRGKAE